MVTNRCRTIYYRGYLSSCNYKCGYCPFSKKSITNEELDKDKYALDKFKELLSNVETAVTIFIVPYGEALIHDYYLETIAQLSSWTNIDKICVQTNNSFNLIKLLGFISTNNGRIDKIRFWCSYHPTQVSCEAFASKCNSLYEAGFSFSVGGVADCAELESLTKMREKLPSDIYMWLNKMDGLNRSYTVDERDKFLNIDPFFQLQLMKIKSDVLKCFAGRETMFVDYKGNVFPCNVSRYRIGNIYEDYIQRAKCRSVYCSCFLAYSNRKDIPLLNIFKDERQVRILPRNDKRAYFFDIDGTILDKEGKISEITIEHIKGLSTKSYVFLNTALPLRHAYGRCKRIWSYIHGGVFANGSDIRIFEYDYKRIIPLESSILTLLEDNKRECFLTYDDGVLHKILFKHPSKTIEKILLLNGSKYTVSCDKSRTIITGINASKLKGALFICRFYNINHNHVTAVGNSENDREMVLYFNNDDPLKKIVENASPH